MSEARYAIHGGDYETGGSASRSLKEHLKKVGADPAVVRRAMIAAYEAEMNVVIHAHRGELIFRLDNGQLDVEVIDEGPGIADIEQALRPGFSTASAKAREYGFGAGMGLPNIQRAADEFDLQSAPGQGTSVRFKIHLKHPTLYGKGRHSVAVKAEDCRQCFHCLRVCPTQALRVRNQQPQVLDYLCVDCAACLAACPTAALHLAGPHAELQPRQDATLLVHPAALLQFVPHVSPQRVVHELKSLGFGDVVVSTGWENALRRVVCELAERDRQRWPIIAPTCPAVLNLIEVRYPSLVPHVAPFLSPSEAAAQTLKARSLSCVVSCPCQQTALRAVELSPPAEFILPSTLRAALQPRFAGTRAAAESEATVCAPEESRVLQVCGIAHVVAVLEQIEDGLATDIPVIEPYACEAAGFGSPLLTEDAFIARHRWEIASLPDDPRAQVVPREKPLAARPGLRLDEDMTKAMQKLARIDKLRRQLPGDDCALCGAPSCTAFAEDVVVGRARAEECPRQDATKEKP